MNSGLKDYGFDRKNHVPQTHRIDRVKLYSVWSVFDYFPLLGQFFTVVCVCTGHGLEDG